MDPLRPSRTALAAARHRAEHQVLEGGRLFKDPLALRILGEDGETVLRKANRDPARRLMRLFIALRTRFAEDALAEVMGRGVRQLVILGAGLDTYAYRTPLPAATRVFEVDHPATQAWKRRRLAEAAIPTPAGLTFAPVDFEHATLGEGLAAAGFDRAAETFFTWLGVVPYLAAAAIWSTLGEIASLPRGAQVVFDYSEPPHSLPPALRASHDELAARVAAIGEQFRTFFEPNELHARLRSLGFEEIEDISASAAAARYFPGRTPSGPGRGGHIVRAAREPHDNAAPSTRGSR